MKNITLEGKIIIFKTLALSKIVCLTLITSFLQLLIEKVQRIQKAFIWNKLTPKIKHETLYNSFKEGGLKNVDINSKIASLHCSWIKQLYDDKFHEWKLIPIHLIKSTFGINFKFHSNLDFDDSKSLTFYSFYKQLFCNWRKYLSSSVIFDLLFYHNQFGITNNKLIYVKEFAKQNIIFLYDLFNAEIESKTWDEKRIDYNLSGKSYFKWRQIVNSIPKTWKKVLKENQSDCSNLVFLNHQLLKNNRTIGNKEMNSKEIYFIIISSKVNIPTSRIYFGKKISPYNFQWKDIYTLPRKVTINAYFRSFQYKILNCILYLNKKVHTFGLSNT